MKREEIKQGFEIFADTVIRMDRRMSDRDNTVMLSLRYDSFTEYFDEQKKWFIFGFSTIDKFFVAMFKNYCIAQISCFGNDVDRDREFELMDIFLEICMDNVQKFKDIIKLKYPSTYKEIEQTYSSMIGERIYTHNDTPVFA